MAFFEVELFRGARFNSTGGGGFSTDVVGVESGFEQRNRNWAKTRMEFNISLKTPGPNYEQFIDALHTFFELIAGRSDAFRFFYPVYCRATAQVLAATADPKVFQLQRTRSLGGRTSVRTVTKPITSSVIDCFGNALAETVNIYVSSALQTSGYTVDHTTGLVTFASTPGDTPTADFDFDIPVRLDVDKMALQQEESAVRAGRSIVSWNSVPLIEVRPPNY